MARRTRKTGGGVLAPRVVYLPDALTRPTPVQLTPEQLAAKQLHDRELYLRWKERQLAIAARDREVRRFVAAAGLAVGVGLVAATGFACWWVWHAITTATVNVDGGLVAFVVLGVVVVGAKIGHHCVTTITHRH